MKKISFCFALFAVLFFVVSCGGGESADPTCEKIVMQGDASTILGGIEANAFDENGNKIRKLTFQFWKESEEEEDVLIQPSDIYYLKGKTINLGEDKNATYNSCRECVLLSTEPDESGEFTRFFFATSGYLQIEDAVENSCDSKGNGSFVLSEIDLSGNDSAMVKHGKCYEIESFNWNTIKETDTESEE